MCLANEVFKYCHKNNNLLSLALLRGSLLRLLVLTFKINTQILIDCTSDLAKQLILHIDREMFPNTVLKLVNCIDIDMDREFGRTKPVLPPE